MYVGGFKIDMLLRRGSGLEFAFYQHGRRGAPWIAKEQHKIIFLLGNYIVVPSVILNTLRMQTFDDITSERLAQGTWTIISPSKLLSPTEM
jgi:hypothetical protein